MSRLSAAIDVATEYAVHLHEKDGLPREQAIVVAVSAVVRAARANPQKFLTPRKQRPVQTAGVGWSGTALAAIGSTLSAIGWIKTLFG
jgi:hypothetical protein